MKAVKNDDDSLIVPPHPVALAGKDAHDGFMCDRVILGKRGFPSELADQVAELCRSLAVGREQDHEREVAALRAANQELVELVDRLRQESVAEGCSSGMLVQQELIKPSLQPAGYEQMVIIEQPFKCDLHDAAPQSTTESETPAVVITPALQTDQTVCVPTPIIQRRKPACFGQPPGILAAPSNLRDLAPSSGPFLERSDAAPEFLPLADSPAILHITAQDWEPDQPGELRVLKGMLVYVSYTAAHGWVYAGTLQTEANNSEPPGQGWLPQGAVKRASLGTVTVDWLAEGCGTLSVVKGDVIAVSELTENGWAYGQRLLPCRLDRHREGWLPNKALEYLKA